MEESKDGHRSSSPSVQVKPNESSYTQNILDPELVTLIEKMQQRKVTTETMNEWLVSDDSYFELWADFQAVTSLIDRANNCKP